MSRITRGHITRDDTVTAVWLQPPLIVEPNLRLGFNPATHSASMATGVASTLLDSFESLKYDVYLVLQTEDDLQYEQQVNLCNHWLAYVAQHHAILLPEDYRKIDTGVRDMVYSLEFHRRAIDQLYHPKGYNSLWHHGTKKSLIRWNIVVHGFFDNYSRLITGIHASNNNSAQSVLSIFSKAVSENRLPSRVCGDDGEENVLVADYMEGVRGSDRGSYIWGRASHNFQLGRFWTQYTRSIGSKWQHFFEELEDYYGLNIDKTSHIWLLHFLFLEAINEEITMWAGAWNHHKMTFSRLPRGQASKSPKDQQFFGAMPIGSFQPPPDDINLAGDPFIVHVPDQFCIDEVHPPDCPLAANQVQTLKYRLARLPRGGTMEDRRTLWVEGLTICSGWSPLF